MMQMSKPQQKQRLLKETIYDLEKTINFIKLSHRWLSIRKLRRVFYKILHDKFVQENFDTQKQREAYALAVLRNGAWREVT